MESSKIELSQDGSHTVYSNKYSAHYHSIYGAIEEAIHVFISAGLYYKYRQANKDLRIFEMGLGTGLNAYLTLLESKKLNTKVEYISVETDPISLDQANLLNYSDQIINGNQELFQQIHKTAWDTPLKITNHFTLEKHQTPIQNFTFEESLDIIYFDAFAPSCQPELWEEDIHRKLYNSLNPSGVLVTYCAKGQFKRMLKSLGYRLEMVNGPNKKREMTRAVKV